MGSTMNDASLGLRLDSLNLLDQESNCLMNLFTHCLPYSPHMENPTTFFCTTESESNVASQTRGFYDSFRNYFLKNETPIKKSFTALRDAFIVSSTGGEMKSPCRPWVSSKLNILASDEKTNEPHFIEHSAVIKDPKTNTVLQYISDNHNENVNDSVESEKCSDDFFFFMENQEFPLIKTASLHEEAPSYQHNIFQTLSSTFKEEQCAISCLQALKNENSLSDSLKSWSLNDDSLKRWSLTDHSQKKDTPHNHKVSTLLPSQVMCPKDPFQDIYSIPSYFWDSSHSSRPFVPASNLLENSIQSPMSEKAKSVKLSEPAYFFSNFPTFEIASLPNYNNTCVEGLMNDTVRKPYIALLDLKPLLQGDHEHKSQLHDSNNVEPNISPKQTSPECEANIEAIQSISADHAIPSLAVPQNLFCADQSLRLDVFKVYPCQDAKCSEGKFFGTQHNKKTCPYYHSQRDRRRHPGLQHYKAEQCNHHFNVDTDGPLRCPYKDACDRCHNHHELLYHPLVYKQRFCSSYNHLECHRGNVCAFAHSRSDIRCELFSIEDEENPGADFFMNLFKTLWCPYGVQHDWHGCLYAHTYQDCRRAPQIGYSSEPCPYWKKDLHSVDYDRRCPSGARCSYAHGSKEQLYHASCYKIMPCVDYRARKTCPRGIMCAFYHEPHEKRYSITVTNPYKVLPDSLMKNLQKKFSKPLLFNIESF